MIFGRAPTFDEIMISVSEIDAAVNQIPREGDELKGDATVRNLENRTSK
jgi:hypothetical protein